MTVMRFSFTFILLLALGPFMGFAQSPHPILNSFTAYKQPNGILLRWVIKGGNQCNGTKVLRSADGIAFEEINHIAGIWGSTTENETYSYFDSIPIPNAYNHYKLELGFQGFTEPITVFFEDFGKANHVVLDNGNGSYRILFSNDLNDKAVLQVVDRAGKPIYEEVATDSDFEFTVDGWRAGVYIFRITGVSKVDISGKIYFGGQ